MEDITDSVKTKNFKKFAVTEQFGYFTNALKNFTGIEGLEILKLMFEQLIFECDFMKKKIK